MPNFRDFLKQNVKGAAVTAAVFGPDVVKSLGEGESKFAVIGRLLGQLYFLTAKWLQPLQRAFIGGWMILGFKAMGDAFRNIVRDSGSLEAALRKLQTIQFSARQFAPFLGGLGAAKQRVSELLALSARGPFKFEELAGASRSLEIFTHGAFSGSEATKQIGMSAIASGNNIGDVADAVGNLYQSLRSGTQIEGAVEQLRRLGTVSQSTAGDLVAMSKSGASGDEVFHRFTANIKTSTEEMKDDLATVTAEHAKAAEELQRKFGEPWTDSEIQNTKNMTAAMQAIAPTVGRVSETLATLFNGFATVKTQMIAVIAKSETGKAALEGLAKGLATVASVGLLVGTIFAGLLVPKLILAGAAIQGFLLARLQALGVSLATSTVLAARFAGVFQALSVAGTIGVAVAGLAALAGAVYNTVESFRQTYREADKLAASFAKGNQAIRDQINNVKSLADHHDALAASMNQVISAHSALIEARAKDAADATGFTINPIQQVLQGVQAVEQLTGRGGPRTRAAAKAEEEAQHTLEFAAKQKTEGLTGPEREEVLEQRAQEAQQEQTQQFERRLVTAAPHQRIAIHREQAQFLEQQSEEGKAGLLEREKVAERGAGIEGRRAVIQVRSEGSVKSLAAEEEAETDNPRTDIFRTRRIQALKKQIAEDAVELNRADAAALEIRLKAKEGTAVKESARAEQLRHAVTAGVVEEEIKRAPAPKAPEQETEEQKTEREQRTKQFETEKTLAGGRGVIRTEAGRDEAKREIELLEASAKVLRAKEEQATTNAENSRMISVQADEDERLYGITLKRAQAEREIAEMGGTGIARAESNYRINQQLIAAELKGEQDRAKAQFELRKKTLADDLVKAKAEFPQDMVKIQRIEQQQAENKPEPDQVRIAELKQQQAQQNEAIDAARSEYNLALLRADAEEQISALKGTALERARGEYEISQRLIEDEIKHEHNRSQAVYERRKEAITESLAEERAKPAAEQKPEVIEKLEAQQKENKPDSDLDQVRLRGLAGERTRRELAFDTAQREYNLTLLRLATEEEIADLKGTAIERAEGEYQINKRSLDEELRAEHEKAAAQYEISKKGLADQLAEERAKPEKEQDQGYIRDIEQQQAENRPTVEPEVINRVEAERARQEYGIETARREYGLTLARVDAEQRIAGLRGTASERAEAEYRIRRQLLTLELQAEEEKARNQAAVRAELLTKQIEEEKTKPEEDQDQNKIKELQTELSQNKPVVDQEKVGQINTELAQDTTARLDRLRTQQVARTQQDIELASHAARRGGRTQQALSLEDIESFAKHFEENRQVFGEAEARSRAFRQTGDEIAEAAYKPGGLKAVADSLQRIGGGGGVYAPGGDPRLQVAKRQAVLLESIDRYMKMIAGKESGVY